MGKWIDEYEATQKQFGGAGLTRTVNNDENKEFGLFDHVADIAKAIPRGIEGAVQDVYGLADTLTGDILPDYDTRFLGESETMAGGIIEGISNFAAGFVPVVGWLGRGAKVGRTVKLAKGLTKSKEAAAKLAGFEGVRGAGGLGAAGIDVTRAAVAGAITDFAVFDGHEARLSNMVQNYPSLANPITEFLAADEGDSEIEGRLKSALEGLGIGAAIDTFLLGLRHYRAGRQAQGRGASPKEAQETADLVVPPSKISSNLEQANTAGGGEDEFAFTRIVPDSIETRNLPNKSKGTVRGTLGMGGEVGMSPLTKDEKLGKIRTIMTMAAEQGDAGGSREWYERSGQEILKLTGGNVDEADKVAQLMGIFSPQTPVAGNMEFALQAYYRSQRMTRDAFTSSSNIIGNTGRTEQAARVLYDEEWLPAIVDSKSGRKISNFYNDLMVSIDPSRDRARGATMDMWMSRFFNYSSKKGSTGKAVWTVSPLQYDFMLARTKEVADDLGWEMHQVQSTIWAYSKSLWDSIEDEVLTAAEAAGIKGGSLKDGTEFGDFYLARFQDKLKSEFKLEPGERFQPDQAFDLREVLRSKSIILSDSSLPSPGSGILEGIHNAPWERKQQYLAEMQGNRLIDGQDVIEEALGFGPRTKLDPADQTVIPSPGPRQGGLKKLIREEDGSKLDPVALRQSRAYAMVEGLYHGKNEVSGVQIFEGGQVRKVDSNSVKVSLGRRRSDLDLTTIQEAITKAFGKRKIAVAPLDDGFVIINVGGAKSAKFVDQARELVDDLTLPEAQITRSDAYAEHFSISSGTQDGSGFRKLLEKDGYGEALKRLDDVYGPNVSKTQRKYSSGGLGESPRIPDLPPARTTGPSTARGGPALDRNAARIEDIRGNAAPLNADGTVTLYYRTSRSSAQAIIDTGSFGSGSNLGDSPALFSTLDTGARSAGGAGYSVVKVNVDPRNVTINNKWRGEVWVSVRPDDLRSVEVDQSVTTFSKDQISAANKTARVWKRTTAGDAARRLAPDFMPKEGTVLDFGAGKDVAPDKYYGKGLIDDGYDVTLYEFGDNLGATHDAAALSRQYDMVMVSNVVNVQQTDAMLDATLDQVARSTSTAAGRVIINLPGSPRKGAFKGTTKTQGAELLREKLLERFAKVELVGGTKAEPVFMASGKLQEPHTGGFINPRIESAAPGITGMREGLARQGMNFETGKNADVLVSLVQRRYGGEILEAGGHKWNRLVDGTEIDLNSGAKGGNGWDPVVNEGKVNVVSAKEIAGARAAITKEVDALDAKLAADALNDPVSKTFADSKALDRLDGDPPSTAGKPSTESVKVRERGLAQIMQRLRLEQFGMKQAGKNPTGNLSDSRARRAAQQLDDHDIHILDKFMRTIGAEMFEDIHLKIRANPDILGRFEYIEGILTVSKKALEQGLFQETIFHEMWHHLSRYVDDGTVANLNKQFERDRKKYYKANPDAQARIKAGDWTSEEYRWTDLDEWFAETMKDKSLDKIRQMDESSKSLFAHAKRVFLEMIAMIKSKFGVEHTQRVLDQFMTGKVADASWMGSHAPGKGQPRLPGAPGSSRFRDYSLEDADVLFSKSGSGKDKPRRPVRMSDVEAGVRDLDLNDNLGMTDARVGILRPLGITDVVAKNILDNIDNRISEGYELGINPRKRVPSPEGGMTYKYTKADLLDRHLQRTDLNLSHYSGPEDAHAVMRAFEDIFRSTISEDVDVLRPRTYDDQINKAHEELRTMVGSTSRDDQSLQVQLQRDIADDVRQLEHINARVLAYKNIQQSMSKLIGADIKAYRLPDGNSDTAQALLRNHVEFLANLTAGIKGLTSLQGRGLGSGNIPITGVLKDPIALDDFLRQRGGRKGTDRLVTMLESALNEDGVGLLSARGIGSMNRLLKPSFSTRMMNLTNAYWINQILSGGQTMFINGFSGVLTSIYRPLEGMLGASVTLNGSAFTDYASELGGLFLHAQDSFKFAWKSAKTGQNILDPGRRVMDTVGTGNAMDPSNFGIKDESLFGVGAKYLGNALQIPTRVLTSTDEFFKQLNYRSVGHRKLIREGMAMGKTGDALAAHVHERMAVLVDEGQAYTAAQAYKRGVKAAQETGLIDPEEIRAFAIEYTHLPPEKGGFDRSLDAVSKDALEVAEDVTFTKALATDSLPAWLQRISIQSPWMRFIVPFVRTPMNIAYSAGQRFDVPGTARVMYHKLRKEDIHLREAQNRMMKDWGSGDPKRRSEAVGRLTAGTMASYYLFGKAQEGIISGRGPSDPEMRQILRDAGWQPYSVKTSDGWVSFSRVDPFATVIGTIADIYDHIRYSPIEEQEETSTAVAGLAIALAQNFTNKTYLAGISNVLQALDQPDRHMSKLARTYASSMIPFSSFQGQSLYTFGDEHMRDVQSMTEALMAKTPFYSDQVRPLRNVLGDPVRRTTSAGTDKIGSVMNMFFPLHYTQTTDDVLKLEFEKLGHGFTPPKPRTMGLDLTGYSSRTGQDAFDRWQELNGKVSVRGKTLKQSLRKLINSREYLKLTPYSDFKAQSPRIGKIKSVLERFKAEAFERLLKEYPDLARDYKEIITTRKTRGKGQTFGGF